MSAPNLLDKCCLVGESVGGDPTHFMVERALTEAGLDWRFLSFQVAPERLAEALAGADALGLRGVRLRGAAADRPVLSDHRTERSRRTGRVTHLTRHDGVLQGDDATGPALFEALASTGGDPQGKRVVVLGGGGAAPSIADVMVEQGAALVAVADPSPDRAAAIALAAQQSAKDRLGAEALALTVETLRWERDWIDLPDGFDWLLATGSWPKEDNAHVAQMVAPDLRAEQTVLDLSIGSSRSPLLAAADECGAAVVDGLPVLIAETALVIEAWTGAAIDRVVLRDAAEEFLGV